MRSEESSRPHVLTSSLLTHYSSAALCSRAAERAEQQNSRLKNTRAPNTKHQTPDTRTPEQGTVINDKESNVLPLRARAVIAIEPKVLAGLDQVINDLDEKVQELEVEVEDAKRKSLNTLP